MSLAVQTTLFDTQTNTDDWFSNAQSVLHIDDTPGWPDLFGEALQSWKIESNQPVINVLSLFSGAGGLDIGFHDAGFNIVECNEIEPSFADTLIANSKSGCRLIGANIVCKDIADYIPSIQNIDFIIGGPPCQTFSAAGARAAGVNGTDDARGNLFRQYVRILKQLKPKGFLFENVYRIIGAQNGEPWKVIQSEFRAAGYNLFWRILDAADYGVPQHRERVIIIGLRDGEYLFPFPSHGPDSPICREYYNAGTAVRDLHDPTLKIGINGRHGHLLNEIPPGLNYSYYTDKMGHPRPIFGWRSKFSDYLYKADPETPVRTIKAQGGQYTGPFHWKNRPFTVEEYKRLQTFPDNYQIMGNQQTIIHQLGNSVPPQLARILALSILSQVFSCKLPFEMSYMPTSHNLGFRVRKRDLTERYQQKAKEAIKQLSYFNDSAMVNEQGIDNCILDRDFNFHIGIKNGSGLDIEYSLYNGQWNISIGKTQSASNLGFKYTIFLDTMFAQQSKISKISLLSYSEEVISIPCLWKYLEVLIKKHTFKDDLVQFFGYYQYSLRYTISLEVLSNHLRKHNFWKILLYISNEVDVGQILNIKSVSHSLQLREDDILNELRNIKQLGYEIRNQNTNQQIPHGHILVPYGFPTLNERSLQRLTEL